MVKYKKYILIKVHKLHFVYIFVVSNNDCWILNKLTIVNFSGEQSVI